jgi:hypothetical protein
VHRLACTNCIGRRLDSRRNRKKNSVAISAADSHVRPSPIITIRKSATESTSKGSSAGRRPSILTTFSRTAGHLLLADNELPARLLDIGLLTTR